MMLENGMIVAFRVTYPITVGTNWGNAGDTWAKDYIGSVVIDTNGIKGPDKIGIDVFLLPFGRNGMFVSPAALNANSSNIIDHQKSTCYNKDSTGYACGVWILLRNNMKYKYHDVSAEW